MPLLGPEVSGEDRIFAILTASVPDALRPFAQHIALKTNMPTAVALDLLKCATADHQRALEASQPQFGPRARDSGRLGLGSVDKRWQPDHCGGEIEETLV